MYLLEKFVGTSGSCYLQIVCKSEYLVTKNSLSSFRVFFNICIKVIVLDY